MAFEKILLSSKLVGKSTEVLTIATIISIISIAKATRLVSKTTRSLYRHIQPTDKSRHNTPQTTFIPRQEPVDVTLDSYAFTPTVISGGKEEPNNNPTPNASNNELFLQQQIVRLQKELAELREESEERENRLLTLIENKFFGRSFVLKKFLKKLLK
jgi:hypothetical protein